MATGELKILIRSFSFTKSELTDETGHGIGHVFDLRGIDNPGRIDAMKRLTGYDRQVIDYLEQETKMPEMIESISRILDIHVVEFLKRGLLNICVNFGCTGGQHRSVYAANTMADYLLAQYPVTIEVRHLMREKWQK